MAPGTQIQYQSMGTATVGSNFIDFTAAGTLLNWVSARQGEGRQVQFVEVHRLVAAFFNVIGIGEHARIVARRD